MKNSIKISILMVIAIISTSNLFAATRTWSGATSTAWATASNWGGTAPATGDDVIIPAGLTNYPVLAANVTVNNFTLNGGTFSTANFNLTVTVNLIVNNGTFSAGTGTINANVFEVNNGTFTIQGDKLTTGNDFIIDGGTVSVTGTNLNIGNDLFLLSGTLDLNSYNLTVVDDYTYSGGSIVDAGSLITAANVIWNFTGFTHTLPTDLYTTGSMTFTSGIVVSSSSALVRFDYNATVSNVSNSSHINGPVRKEISNSNTTPTFIFPIGDGTNYAPLQISAYASRRNQDFFTAEYFNTRNTNAGGTKGTGLALVSQAEYWDLVRGASAGTASTTVSIQLSYNSTRSGSVTNAALLKVALWNGTQWVDNGRSAGAGTNTAGTLISSTTRNAFGAFTIGSSTNVNPLPVHLLNFNAAAIASNVNVKWTTTSEINNDFFNVEKSLDGKNWSVIGTVKGAGNTEALTNYNFVDANPVMGMQYYRLQQTDINGQFTYSSIAPVNFSTTITSQLNIFPMPANNFINVELPGATEMMVTIYNANGQKVFESTSSSLLNIDIQDLNAGLYIVEVKADNNVISSKFLKN